MEAGNPAAPLHGTGVGSAHREVTSYDMAGTVERLQQLAMVAQGLQQKAIRNKESRDELAADPKPVKTVPTHNLAKVFESF